MSGLLISAHITIIAEESMDPQCYRLLEALSAPIYLTDEHGRLTFYNTAAAAFWGREPAIGEMWCGSWRIFRTNGQPLPHDQCPMAIALREGREVRGIEAVAERPNGERAPFLPFPTPLRDSAGRVTGAVNLLVDLTGVHAAEIEKAKLAAIVESSDDAIISKALTGEITSWNRGAQRIFGYSADEIIGQPITQLIPLELHAEEARILKKLSEGERIEHYETVRVTKTGRRVDISLTISPLRDGSGNIIGASKVARDITERKHSETIRQLLLSELNHRVKNTLATVDALARQTLSCASDPAVFVEAFGGRLKALARANTIFTSATVNGEDVSYRAEIGEIIRTQTSLSDELDDRIRCSGPRIALQGQAALHLSLVLHELGTNARKHGSLSAPTGGVLIDWTVESRDGQRLALVWREFGGPPVAVPASTGFGSKLIEQSLQAHGGAGVIEYAVGGVICRIDLPLAEDEEAPTMSDRADEPRKERARRRSDVSGARVLLVEDEALIAMVAASYLSEAGCQVIGPASTIPSAINLIETQNIDVALLDANIGGSRVDEIADALANAQIPFAFVTGYGRSALPGRFKHATSVDKPFSQNDLVSALDAVLSSHANVVTLRKTS